jgi:hypothetical protein
MPKCSNDETKSYTGNEPTPKGLGFSASVEELGKIMVGLDGSDWIVTQTKTCKKWVKVKNETTSKKRSTKPKTKKDSLDFDNMEEDCYTYTYLPDVDENELIDETGLEEKFGGSKPFFIEGETWPLFNEDSNMYFLCQFKDPRKEDNILFRVFSTIEEDEEDTKEDLQEKDYAIFKILPIELSEENLKKQIFLNPPLFKNEYKSYQIKRWNPLKELRHVSYIINKYSLKFEEKYFNEYFTSKYLPSKETKLGGTHILMGTLGNILGEDNFLQLNKPSSKYLPSTLKCYGLELLFWNK